MHGWRQVVRLALSFSLSLSDLALHARTHLVEIKDAQRRRGLLSALEGKERGHLRREYVLLDPFLRLRVSRQVRVCVRCVVRACVCAQV
jgi:hypothetical protein